MGLAVIGAGFGRTGTESMKLALERLGLGPCYHMTEVLPNPDRVAEWRQTSAGVLPDWDVTFAGFGATVDWPAAFFWRELAAFYPNAKILLTVRDADSWYDSMDKTIFRVLRESDDPASIGEKLIAEGVFGGRFDRDHAIKVFNANTAAVQAAFSSDRLLTFTIGDGWEPLCRFLDQPVRDEPFPHSNRPGEFDKMMEEHDTPG